MIVTAFGRVNFGEVSAETSVAQASETYDPGHYDRTTIIAYKRHVRVAKNIVYLVAVAVFLLCLILPYAQVYHVCEVIVTKLIDAGLKHRVKVLSNLIGLVMSKIELIAVFWEDMTKYPLNYGLEQDMVQRILFWALDARAALRPSPNDYILCDGMTYLQISMKRDDTFTVYYSLPTADSSIVTIKRYPSTTDFGASWDPETSGETVKTVNVSDLALQVPPNTWVSSDSLLLPSEINELPMLFVAQTNQTYVGLTMSMKDLYDVIMMTLPSVSTFALLDKDWGVTIVGDIGPIPPLSTGDGGNVYPKLNQINSTTWAGVWEVLETNPDDETLLTIEIDEVFYFMYLTNVSSQLGPNGKLIFVIDHDDLLKKSYIPISSVFVIEVVAMAVVFLILFWALKFVQRKLQRKLMDKKPLLTANADLKYFGAVGNAIYIIRHLQLMFPEQRTLNNVLDRAVEHIAEQPRKHFDKVKGGVNCGFCQYLVEKNMMRVKKHRTEEYPYSTWKKSVKKMAEFVPKLLFSDIESNPKKQLMRFMMMVMESRQLLFDFADPDSLLRFVDDFAENHCRDVTYVVMVQRKLYMLLRAHFRYWMFDRLELFALYIAILVGEANFEKTKEEKLFKDRVSRHAFKMQHIVNILRQHFPAIETDSEGVYFLDFLSFLVEALDSKVCFEIMGLLRTRMEVSTFSVTHSKTDRLVFAANLIRLCQFCPYFCEQDEMLKGAEILACKFLSQSERTDEDFVAGFHFVTVRSIVRRLFDIFQTFKPMKEMDENLKASELYWAEKSGELESLNKYTNNSARASDTTDSSSAVRRESLFDDIASPNEPVELSQEMTDCESQSETDSNSENQEEEEAVSEPQEDESESSSKPGSIGTSESDTETDTSEDNAV